MARPIAPEGADRRTSDGDLVALLLRRAREQAEETAYVFVDGGGVDEVSWRALAARSAALAERIGGAAAPGDRVLIMVEPGLSYIAALFGCFMAGVIAVPCYPPRSTRTLDAAGAIAADCAPALVLADARGAAALAKAGDDRLAGLAVASADGPWPERFDDLGTARGGCPVALLQYTSGSTGSPKGVVISHANLCANLAAQQRLYQVDAASRGVIWLPPYHDMGLGSGILQPLWSGSAILLMAPGFAMQRPLRWLEAIDAFGATVSGGPPFAYAACVASLRAADEPVALDLSSWACAFVGAEPIPPATMRAFCEAFAPHGFRPGALTPSYGLAEATLLVAGTRGGIGAAELADGRVFARCGPVIEGHDLLIVDPERRTPSPPDAIGEIWLAGPSVAGGYWQKPAATAETFDARLADGRGPYLRTGDLGQIVDGELIVTGRRKNIVILSGRKLHCEDIEAAIRAELEATPDRAEIGALAAAASTGDGGERLRLFIEASSAVLGDPARRDAIRRAATQILARKFDARLDAIVFERRGRLPRTSSGKLRRADLFSILPTLSPDPEVRAA